MDRITSPSNEKIKYFSKLKNKSFRDAENKYIIEGIDLIDAALNAGIIETIITSNQNYTNKKIEVLYVTPEILKKICFTASPQDIVGVCKIVTSNNEIVGKTIILDDIQDPGNAGTIVRTALAFGFETIVFSMLGVDIYNDKFLRACKGANYSIKIVKEDLEKIYKSLKKNKYYIVGTGLEDSKELKEIKKGLKTAVVLGNEGNGISSLSRENCSIVVKIPISDKIESLNVAVAGSILMYELSK